MKKAAIFLSALLFMIFMAGCSSGKENTVPNNSGNSGKPLKSNETSGVQKVDKGLLDYFLADGAKAHFRGEGQNFSELDVQFAMPYENYVIVHESNGQAIVRYVYQIGEKQITTLSYDLVDSTTDFPSLDEIKKMEPVGVYLHKPFEKGQLFGQWEIVETDVPVETYFKDFDNAFVLQSTEPIIGAENKAYIIKKYFVEGFGEVKRESIMKTADGEHLVMTSTLESVSQP